MVEADGRLTMVCFVGGARGVVIRRCAGGCGRGVASAAAAAAARRRWTHGAAPSRSVSRATPRRTSVAATLQPSSEALPLTGNVVAEERAGAAGDARPNVIDVLRSRELIEQLTHDEELRKLCESRQSVYCGFDPTADSLHLGNYLALVTLRWFQLCGHRPVAIVGGATGRIGDPSGKSSERPSLSDEVIAANLRGISKNVMQVLMGGRGGGEAVDGATEPLVLNNNDWVGPVTFLDFLRDVGRFARVGSMLAKDSVKSRIGSEEGMSFTEFTYQLLQANDFVHLHDEHGVRIQIGGSDQWGNITAGTELARKVRGVSLYGVTIPLLVRADGRKFGKSEDGAIWLSKEKLSPYQMYQYLYRMADADVCSFLRKLTFLDLERIRQLEQSMSQEGYVANTAQKLLAEEVVRIVHGDEGVRAALAATAIATPGKASGGGGGGGGGGDGGEGASLTAETLLAIAADMPNVSLGRGDVVGQSVIDVLVRSGLQSSRGEARRLIKNGGGYVNNTRVSAAERVLTEDDLIDGQMLLLAAGKKSKMLVQIN